MMMVGLIMVLLLLLLVLLLLTVRLLHRLLAADRVGGALRVDVVAEPLGKVPAVPHHQLLIWHNVSSCIKVNVVLVLARDQVHHLQIEGGRHVAHPVGLLLVGAVQIVVVVIFEDLRAVGEWVVETRCDG